MPERVYRVLAHSGPSILGSAVPRLDDPRHRPREARRQAIQTVAASYCTSSISIPSGRGRPSLAWSLTDLADELFPDRHADLTVSLIQATCRATGDPGLEKVVAARAREQLRLNRNTLPGPSAILRRRVDALARQRTAEGYMAEVRRDGDRCAYRIEPR
jgi:predicted ArsR family transcriptional regulator